MKILLVEDDRQIGSSLKKIFALKGCICDWVSSIKEGYERIELIEYDVFIFDWMLPDGNGKDLVYELRELGIATPILMLTARREIEDKVQCLEVGCDDYLTKPFDFKELYARVCALSRRKVVNPKSTHIIKDMELNMEERYIQIKKEKYSLSSTEAYLLEILFLQKGLYVSKSLLEEKLRRFDKDMSYNSIEAHISRIRKRIGSKYIRTLRGVGYKIGGEEE